MLINFHLFPTSVPTKRLATILCGGRWPKINTKSAIVQVCRSAGRRSQKTAGGRQRHRRQLMQPANAQRVEAHDGQTWWQRLELRCDSGCVCHWGLSHVEKIEKLSDSLAVCRPVWLCQTIPHSWFFLHFCFYFCSQLNCWRPCGTLGSPPFQLPHLIYDLCVWHSRRALVLTWKCACVTVLYKCVCVTSRRAVNDLKRLAQQLLIYQSPLPYVPPSLSTIAAYSLHSFQENSLGCPMAARGGAA